MPRHNTRLAIYSVERGSWVFREMSELAATIVGSMALVALVRFIPKMHNDKILTAGLAGGLAIVAVPVLILLG